MVAKVGRCLCRNKLGETPVEHIRSRIKTAEGMQEKVT